MSELIDKQAAIDAMKNMYQNAEKWGREAADDVIKARAESCMATLVEMKLRIEKLPSAQPERPEIIRCRDCKHWDGADTCDVIDAPVWDNDFCSMAERRSDE